MPRKTSKGFNAERELARKLWEAGIAVMRAPASGAGTRRIFYPDLLAIYRKRIAVIEVKYRTSASSYIRIDHNKLKNMFEYARRAGGEVFIAVRLPNIGWRFFKIDEPGNKTSYRVEELVEKSFDLEAFLRYLKGGSILNYIDSQTGKLSASKDSVRE